VTAVAGIRPVSSTVSQWSVLTGRLISPMLRNGEIFVALAASAAVTVSFYGMLHQLLAGPDLHESNYGQYLTPLIALQAMSFASVSTAFRASTDSVGGLNRRFRAMPIALLNPLVARLSARLCRNAVGLVVALVCGYVIGFRFYRGPLETIGFCLLVLAAGAALAFLADAVGTSSLNPAAAAQWLLLPQLILGLASVGLQPVQRFPEWIQPIVRDQPISQLVYALQALAGDRLPDVSAPTWSVTGPALVWVAGGMVALLPLAVHLYRRMI
jgi:ABC-2 type transport system permease protein